MSGRRANILRRRYAEQDGRCIWCGQHAVIRKDVSRRALAARLGVPFGVPGTRRAIDDLFASVEHVRPRARGGGNEVSNIVMAHEGCNRRRGVRLDICPDPRVLARLPARVRWQVEAVLGVAAKGISA